MATGTLLIIDDSDDFRETASELLSAAGYVAFEARCPEDAFELLRGVGRFDLIICDLHMPFIVGALQHEFVTAYQVGIKTIEELMWVFPDVPVIGLTGTAPLDLLRIKNAIKHLRVYSKPSAHGELLRIVEQSLLLPPQQSLQ